MSYLVSTFCVILILPLLDLLHTQSQVDHYSLLKVLSIYFTLANILLCNAFSYESFYYVIFILRVELLVFNIQPLHTYCFNL